MQTISTSLFVLAGILGRTSGGTSSDSLVIPPASESELGVYELIGHSTCLSGADPRAGNHINYINKQTGSDLECRKLCDEAKYCSGYHWKVDDRWNPGYYPCWLYNGVVPANVDAEPSGGKCWKKAAFEYVLGTRGEKDCPQWSVHIKDFDECGRAAVALKVGNQGPKPYGPGLWYEMPTWCSFRRMAGGSPPEEAFFNRRAVGKNYGEYTAICKRVPVKDRQSPQCPDRPRASGKCETIGMRCDYGDECCCGECNDVVSPLVSTCTSDGYWQMPPSLCKIGMCTPVPVPTPPPTPAPVPTAYPTPSPTPGAPKPTSGKLGRNGKCYREGSTKEERDGACAGDLVCARKGHDGRDFGGCWSFFGKYVAGWPWWYHCCSAVPADGSAKRRLDVDVEADWSETGDFVMLSSLRSAEAFCVLAKERSICGMQCAEVNEELREFLPEGLLDVCIGTDMSIRDVCGNECAAEE